jgi:hypothetical protein
MAPLVGAGGEMLAFRLTVNDGLGSTSFDDVSVHVANANDPPNCDLSAAKPAVLWPPNHSLVPIAITNLSDPNNDQVAITVLTITQDEPVDGLGDGDTSPDAVISGNNILIRSERSGSGDGRIYRITFRANDGFGESCTGSITICAPHSRKPGICVDSGQKFNSKGQ